MDGQPDLTRDGLPPRRDRATVAATLLMPAGLLFLFALGTWYGCELDGCGPDDTFTSSWGPAIPRFWAAGAFGLPGFVLAVHYSFQDRNRTFLWGSIAAVVVLTGGVLIEQLREADVIHHYRYVDPPCREIPSPKPWPRFVCPNVGTTLPASAFQ